MLIMNSIDENDKQQDLNDLMTDMKLILTLYYSLEYTGKRAEYLRKIRESLQAALFIVAREFVEHYDLAPIEH